MHHSSWCVIILNSALLFNEHVTITTIGRYPAYAEYQKSTPRCLPSLHLVVASLFTSSSASEEADIATATATATASATASNAGKKDS